MYGKDRAHFTINNQREVVVCISKKLGGLCGNDYWFIGGERCFTDPRGRSLIRPRTRNAPAMRSSSARFLPPQLFRLD
jgi:hypothetical protein